MLNTVALLIFPLLMAYAASSDLLTMRISNYLVLGMVVAFAIVAMLSGMSLEQFGLHFACAAVVLVGAFAFFSFGWIGGGDAKLAAATSLWLGFGLTLPYLVYAALLGGALTLMILALRRLPLTPFIARVTWIEPAARSDRRHSLRHRTRRGRPHHLLRDRDLSALRRLRP